MKLLPEATRAHKHPADRCSEQKELISAAACGESFLLLTAALKSLQGAK